jgi:hypothetical protein
VALRNRAALLQANPNIVILSEVHYHAAQPNFLPPDSPLWIRNADFENNKLGMLDGWHDDTNTSARVGLIRKIRSAVGEKAILLGNVNERLPTHAASYLNGMYMEGLYAHYFPDWHVAAANLIFL